jgi:hypothetical protein
MTNEERLAEIEAWALRDRENPTLLENTSYKMACTGTTCTISDLKSWQSYGPMYEHAGDTLWLIARIRELEAQVAADAKVVEAASMIVSKMTPVEHPSGVVDYAMQGVTNDDWRALVSALAARKGEE